jgi:hypothetical protein
VALFSVLYAWVENKYSVAEKASRSICLKIFQDVEVVNLSCIKSNFRKLLCKKFACAIDALSKFGFVLCGNSGWLGGSRTLTSILIADTGLKEMSTYRFV